MKKALISLTQEPPVFLNKKESIAKAGRIIEDSAGRGSDIVIFPESWLPGYPLWVDSAPGSAIWGSGIPKKLYRLLFRNSLDLSGGEVGELISLAKKHKVKLVVGINEVKGKSLYNSILYINNDPPGFSVHRKLIPTYTERLIWSRGDGSTLNVMKTPFGNVGGLICWEHFMPLARASMYAKRETLHVAQWPSVREIHRIASLNYAFEGNCFVASCGTVISKQDVLDGFDSLEQNEPEIRDFLDTIPGAGEDLLYDGGSCVIAPDATYLLAPQFNSKSTFTVEIDTDAIVEKSAYLDTDGHYSRPDVFKLTVNEREQLNVFYENK